MGALGRPAVHPKADVDPREFLLLVNLGEAEESVRVSFKYYACTDKMCIPVTQEYTVYWEEDKDGGWAQRRAPRRPQKQAAK